MKLHQYLLIAFLIIISKVGFAQVLPPVPYTSDIKINYTRTWEPQVPISDPALITNRPVAEVKQATQYLDASGRPIQTVVKQQSPLQKDMVVAQTYDEFGREQYGYLPFVSTIAQVGDVTNDGKFKMDPFQQQKAFSQVQYPGETFYYSKIDYEPSPLNKIKKTMPAGNSWVGSNKGVNQVNELNVANEVRIWKIATTNALVIPTSTSFYAEAQLYRTISIDEHNKRFVEYKDKQGLVILTKKEIVVNAAIASHTGWLCTYYVYDDYNNVRFVISPKATEQIAANWIMTAAIANELCFQYCYDARGRNTIKKEPGAAEQYMVYDGRSRLVMVQDGNLRQANKWMITLYDVLNRPVQSGILLNTFNNKTFAQHQAAADISTAYPFAVITPPNATFWEMLTETHYDDYTNIPAGLSSSLIATYINATNFITTYNTAPLYAQQLLVSNQNTNQVTWTKTKVLGTATYLGTVNLYDEKGRLIQQQKNNITGAVDVLTTQYDWSGKVLRAHQFQKKLGTNPKDYQVLNKHTYDHAGRLLNIKKTFKAAGVATPEKTIVQNTYDELGQLKNKKLGQQVSNPALPIETLNYDYNIRGWLLGINRDYVKDVNTTNYFGFELGYDKPATIIPNTQYLNTQFNGNISGTIWKSKGDQEKRKYDFSYDAANRILKADFNQYTAGTFNKTAKVDFSSVMGDGINPATAYDANGNILAMKQWGLQLNASAVIDQLTYSYHVNSNKLKAVNDAIVADNKLGDFTNKNTSADDYGYDKNGNLITDLNKKLVGNIGLDQIAGGAIIYNHLNLPQSITAKKDDGVTLKGTIVYTYDATGAKLKKVVTDNTTNPIKITTTLYIGGFEYTNDTLQQVAHEQGRIRTKTVGQSTTYHYDYFISDHLGNTRMILTEEQQADQYPIASMELAQNATESAFYSKIPETRTIKPAGYPVDNTTNPNAYAAKVRGDGNKIGPGITLRVMAGDQFSIKVNSWYKTGGVVPQAATNPLADLLTALTNGVGNLPGSKGNPAQLQQAAVFTPGATNFLNNQPAQGNKPKAYLNWVLFDEQFNFVQSSSGAELVGADNVFTSHVKTNLPVNKNGYLYIYVSNATPNIDVFFDNLQVTHSRGALLEESSYYPFGLQMAGIGSKSAGKLENRYKFNAGTELNSDFDINLYETAFRGYDPQIGRFHQIDPLASSYTSESPYMFAFNNPISYNDPLGLEPKPLTSDIFKDLWNSPFGGSWNANGGITTYGSTEESINSMGVKYSEGSCIWCETVDRALTLSNVVVGSTTHKNNTLADRAFSWANFDKKGAKDWANQRMEYNSLRNNGLSSEQIGQGGFGINNERIGNYERGWQAEQDYRATQMYIVDFASLFVPLPKISFLRFFGGTTSRVFWSGGGKASLAATEFAIKTGGTTLEMTTAGKTLTWLTEQTSYKMTSKLWDFASRRFATGAKGEVNVFMNLSQLRPNATWFRIEQSILESNGLNIITHIK